MPVRGVINISREFPKHFKGDLKIDLPLFPGFIVVPFSKVG
jgi:hypothetical protein